ncbi:hypothetical protein [Nitratireductor alexandrii]|nr:hypothetical protein [Nitratireductor alexandrii]PSM16203.1 hypothetical protein C7T96_21245 [Nitratireductor sp. StC3]
MPGKEEVAMQTQSRNIPYSAFLAAKAACECPGEIKRFLEEKRLPAAWHLELGPVAPARNDDDDAVVMTIN